MKKLSLSILITTAGMLAAQADDAGWHLMPEPQFMRHDVAWPIPGAQRTVLVPARTINGEVTLLKRADITTLKISREDIIATAIENASKVLADIKPEYVRDQNGSIQFAILSSENPYTATVIFAPEFEETFEETLGPDLLVIMPNRNTVLVFPQAAPHFRAVSDMVFSEYRSSIYPISREIFSLKNGRLSAVGLLN